MPTTPDLSAARAFVLSNARLLDRHRFAQLFDGAGAEPVLTALRAYRNDDGGFGHALEPDIRSPASQPWPAMEALMVLDELDAFEDPIVAGACDWLAANSNADGGVTWLLPTALSAPRAPWWQVEEDPPSSLITTAALAGLLGMRRVEHPWVRRATDWSWKRIEGELALEQMYELRSVIWFLDRVADGDRARRALAALAPRLPDSGLVELDPEVGGHVMGPLDYSPLPGSRSRALFDDELVARHVDKLACSQDDDGGWEIGWPVWTPAVGPEWRGYMTVRALVLLRAHGRLR